MNENLIRELMQVPIGELANYNAAKLYELHEEAVCNFEQAKRLREWVEGAISLKYEERVRAKRLHLEKDTGVVHVQDDEFKLSCNVVKKVEWDQRKLQQIVAKLLAKGANIDDLVETTYHIPERKYGEWSSSTQSMFTPARKIRHGKANYKLVRVDADQQEVCYV